MSLEVIDSAMQEGNRCMFATLVNNLSPADVKRAALLVIESNNTPLLDDILRCGLLVLSPDLLDVDISKGDHCLKHLINSTKIKACNKGKCAYATALRNRNEAVITALYQCNNSDLSCDHIEELVLAAINERLFLSAVHMIYLMKCNVLDTTVIAVFLYGDESCVAEMVGSATVIKHEIILECLKCGALSVVSSVMAKFHPALSWNNYALVREAAKDVTSRSLTALGL